MIIMQSYEQMETPAYVQALDKWFLKTEQAQQTLRTKYFYCFLLSTLVCLMLKERNIDWRGMNRHNYQWINGAIIVKTPIKVGPKAIMGTLLKHQTSYYNQTFKNRNK